MSRPRTSLQSDIDSPQQAQQEPLQRQQQPPSSSPPSAPVPGPPILHYFPAPPLPNSKKLDRTSGYNESISLFDKLTARSFTIKLSDHLQLLNSLLGRRSSKNSSSSSKTTDDFPGSTSSKDPQTIQKRPHFNENHYFYCYKNQQQFKNPCQPEQDFLNLYPDKETLSKHLTHYHDQEVLYADQLLSLKNILNEFPQSSGSDSDRSIGTMQASSALENPAPGSKLIWLLFMHRHGDRAPLNMAPRDKYNDLAYWPEGFGNLNNAGRRRMYKLGQYIRRRYSNFLSDNIREVYSRSSDVDRCIESSHAVLAGMYPPTERFEWNEELPWIPAPVHSVPAPEDYLLNEAGRKFLAEVVREIHIVQNSDAVKKLYEDSVAERELLQKELGYEYDMFYKFKCTYSTLDIEERQGLSMPDWYNPELKKRLYKFAGKAFALAGGGTENLKRIRCGHLLEDMVTRMDIATKDDPKPRQSSDFHQPTNAPSEIGSRKIVHYSTHDSIVAAFLEALGVGGDEPVPPGFGATFFIELYVDLDEKGLPSSEKYVKILYMDDTESEKPTEMKLPNSQLDENGHLTLREFKRLVAHLLPTTQTADC